jgi:hypothetical protein
MDITPEQFYEKFGFKPIMDDLIRVNCKETGTGHYHCGVCETHNKPRFLCCCSPFKTNK